VSERSVLLNVAAWAIFVSTRDACVARDWNSSRGQGSADGIERFTGRSPGDMKGWRRADVGVRSRLVLLCRSTGVKDSIQDEKALLAAGCTPAAAVVACPARIRWKHN